MEYRILGAFEVRAGNRVVDLGGKRQQRVLAALLLSPNRVVPLARMIEAGWGGDPPATVERQARNRVAALRAILTRHGGFIDTEGAGYVLRLGTSSLDALVFDELVTRGRAAGDPALLRQALALWRGPALAGLGGDLLSREAAALEEKRLAAVEEWVELELAAGRHAELLTEIRGLVAANPLREKLTGQLVTILYRTGRRDEALDTYRSLATRLADDLGIDPSPALRRIHDAVARDADPAAPSDRDAVVPRQLPADVSGFAGRVGDLARLDAVLFDSQRDTAVVISAIDGTAGVGKTALAVHWAHRVRDKFPDGQLFVNLRGYDPTPPVRPLDALGGFLRALGVPGPDVPDDQERAVTAYRNLLADRRVLVVLDNAASADQVGALLPDTAGCLALITSREALTEVVGRGGRRLVLDVLAPDDALALLAWILGEDRLAAEPEAVADLARLCACLPLALRIAAANLGDRESIAGYVDRLRAGNRLAALAVDGDEHAAVRTAFEFSYAGLPEPARRAFRLLGLVPGSEFTVEATASLVAVPPDQARRLLDRLAVAHLIHERVPGRYAFHDLLRLYAGELVDEYETGADRHAALHRLFDHYLRGSYTADRLYSPHRRVKALPPEPPGVTSVELADADEALAWFGAEHATLLTAIERAASTGFELYACDLGARMTDYLHRRSYWRDLVTVQEVALPAARRIGDRRRELNAHSFLALGYTWLGRYDEAERHQQTIIEVDPGTLLAAQAHLDLGLVYDRQGRYPEALREAQEALDAFRDLGSVAGQGRALSAAGWVQSQLGNHEQALAGCQEALVLFEKLDNRHAVASNWDSIGYAHHHLGQYPEAIDSFERSIAQFRALGDRRYTLTVLTHLGDTYLAAGDRAAAREAWRAALVLADEIDDAGSARLRGKLSDLLGR